PVGDGPVAHPVKREPIKIIEKMCFLFVMGLVHYKLIENLPSENVRTVIKKVVYIKYAILLFAPSC
ncbi:TPA_asm: hypothetical protein G4K75_004000, partial [Salmonella enterica]|nr:hypothetical protein [Salmonella enterica]